MLMDVPLNLRLMLLQLLLRLLLLLLLLPPPLRMVAIAKEAGEAAQAELALVL